MEEIGNAVARAVGAAGGDPPALEGRVVPARRRGVEVVLPALSPALPALPRSLQGWVARAAEPPPPPLDPNAPPEIDGGAVSVPARMPLTPATMAEKAAAREPAERLRRILAARADEATVEAWLIRATAASANAPLDPEARRRWVSAWILVARGRPDAIFSAESAVEAIGRWKFWPSGAEVAGLLDELEERYRAVLRGLEAVERAPVATGPGRERPAEVDLPSERTPEEVAAVQAKAVALVAELRAREAVGRAGRPLSVAARPLSPAQLIALAERQAETMADGPARERLLFRARVLRERHPEAVS